MQMARTGNPASASDAGVGALAARSAILGAELNVRINAASLTDRSQADKLIEKAKNWRPRLAPPKKRYSPK